MTFFFQKLINCCTHQRASPAPVTQTSWEPMKWVACNYLPQASRDGLLHGARKTLTLAHDIVVKGHRSTLSIESREGVLTGFTVRGPA